MKEKNVFIGILVVALIGIVVVAYRTVYKAPEPTDRPFPAEQKPLPGGTPAPAAPGAPSVERPAAPVQVEYMASGFAPAAITVKKGTTVTFVNRSGVGTWVASAPHPTHTDYPEFDALQAVMPGNAYSFTFDRVGTWKYHNHLNATQFGSVTVTE